MKLVRGLAQSCVVLLDKVPADLVLREVAGGGASSIRRFDRRCGSILLGRSSQVLVRVIKITVGSHGV